MSATTTRARPFRLRAPSVPEDDLQASVAKNLDTLLLPPAVWTSLGVGHIKLTHAQAARLARIGVKRGWPDVLVVHQGIYGIELKTPDGRLSTTRVVRTKRGSLRELVGQDVVFPALLAAGFRDIAICETVEAVLEQLELWHVPVRRWR